MHSGNKPRPSAAAVGAELREDLRGEPVLITPGRAARPYDIREDAEERRRRCPFCEGREALTPPEVAAARAPGLPADSPGWTWRVVPNRFPAFPREPSCEGEAFGVHEVIIETPDHDRGLADLSAGEIAAVLEAWQHRLLAAAEDPRMAYANIFKNHGVEAGASLEHAHSQLMATTFVPGRVLGELQAFWDGSAGRRMQEDRENPELRIAELDGFTAYAPAAARFPDEVWIAPDEPEAAFERTASTTAPAVLLRRVLTAMNRLHQRPSFHLLAVTAPFRAEGRERWRWRLETFPRLTKIGGFEWATGTFVNQRDPAETARRYRAELER